MSVKTEMLGHGDSAALYQHQCNDCGATWDNTRAFSTCRACEQRLRYIVIEAWCTGADEHTRHEDLVSALDHRDELRKQRPCGRTGPGFFVFDAENPESGYLDHQDLYEEAHA